MFDAISFAGGGNRCYWQGGFFEAVTERLGLKPKLAVGVSAGAFAGIYSLLGLGPRVRERVLAGTSTANKNIDLAGWRQGGPLYPVGMMYRALLNEMLDAAALARLKAMLDFRLAITRLPRGLPPIVGAALGIGAYQLEKHLFHPVHPRFGRRLGLRSEFISVHDLETPDAFADAIIASSCVPPFMPITRIGTRPAFDGGLVDNVPVSPLEPIEAAGGRSLVLLTRVYRQVPLVPGRTYVQPSEPIPVKQFDVTNPDGIRRAHELGRRDGTRFAAAHAAR